MSVASVVVVRLLELLKLVNDYRYVCFVNLDEVWMVEETLNGKELHLFLLLDDAYIL